MADTVVGVLHPGAMGAAIAAVLRGRGHRVLWASPGRSPATARRAERAGLVDAGSAAAVAQGSEVVLSVCPPHAAIDVARSVEGFNGLFVDANAVSPATASRIGEIVTAGGARFVDGGIVGAPPVAGESTRLYLSGPDAGPVADLFAATAVVARVISERPGAASALKMTYAAWSKGTAALLLAIRAVACAEDVEDELLAEWGLSLPDLPRRSHQAARSAGNKGWRWVGEMEEIASTFEAAGLPGGFHQAAAEVFRRSPRLDDGEADEATLQDVLTRLAAAHRAAGSEAGR